MNLISLIGIFLKGILDSKSISGRLEAFLCQLACWSLKNDKVQHKPKALLNYLICACYLNGCKLGPESTKDEEMYLK